VRDCLCVAAPYVGAAASLSMRLDGHGAVPQSLRAEAESASIAPPAPDADPDAPGDRDAAPTWSTTGEAAHQRLRYQDVPSDGRAGDVYRIQAQVFPGPGVSTVGLRITFRDVGTEFVDVAVRPGAWQTVEASFTAPATHTAVVVFLYPATGGADDDGRAGLCCATGAVTLTRIPAARVTKPAVEEVAETAAPPPPEPPAPDAGGGWPVASPPFRKRRVLLHAENLNDGAWLADSLKTEPAPNGRRSGALTHVTSLGSSRHQRLSRHIPVPLEAGRCFISFLILPGPSVTTVGLRVTAPADDAHWSDIAVEAVEPGVWQRVTFAFDVPRAPSGVIVFLYPTTPPYDDDRRAGLTSTLGEVRIWTQRAGGVGRVLERIGGWLGHAGRYWLPGRRRLYTVSADGMRPVGREFGLPKADIEFCARFWRPLLDIPGDLPVPVAEHIRATILQDFEADKAFLATRHPTLGERQRLVLYAMLRTHGSFASYTPCEGKVRHEDEWLLSPQGNCTHHAVRAMIILWALGIPAFTVTILVGGLNGHVLLSAFDPADNTAYLLDGTMNVFGFVPGATTHYVEEVGRWPLARRIRFFSEPGALVFNPFWHRFVDMSYFAATNRGFPLHSADSFNAHHLENRERFYWSFFTADMQAAARSGRWPAVIRYRTLGDYLTPWALDGWLSVRQQSPAEADEAEDAGFPDRRPAAPSR